MQRNKGEGGKKSAPSAWVTFPIVLIQTTPFGRGPGTGRIQTKIKKEESQMQPSPFRDLKKMQRASIPWAVKYLKPPIFF